jgi:hypothetical protein
MFFYFLKVKFARRTCNIAIFQLGNAKLENCELAVLIEL